MSVVLLFAVHFFTSCHISLRILGVQADPETGDKQQIHLARILELFKAFRSPFEICVRSWRMPHGLCLPWKKKRTDIVFHRRFGHICL